MIDLNSIVATTIQCHAEQMKKIVADQNALRLAIMPTPYKAGREWVKRMVERQKCSLSSSR